MLAITLAFLVSVVSTGWAVGYAGLGARSAFDPKTSGPQTFHARPVPRIGGAGVFCGLLVATTLLMGAGDPAARLAALLLVCALPVCVVGLIEDLTQLVSPRKRLMAAAASAALAFWLLDARITDTDIPWLDALVSLAAGSLALTLLAVSGMTHAVNIIDGFNGLASMCVVIMLAALAIVAFQVGDSGVGMLALIGISAVLGFFVWNFPRGLVFLGDGGAYLLGFYVAEVAILLLVRNPQVSPLFPVLVCAYPIFEMLFSIFRRRVLRARPACQADGIHLHSLIYRRVTRWAPGVPSGAVQARRNSMTSPFLWLLCTFPAVLAVLFQRDTAFIAAGLVLFALSYTALYWRMVRFKTPRWLGVLRQRETKRARTPSQGFARDAVVRETRNKFPVKG